ncbi:hypothetical protein BZG36_00122 [Bifiguratus adelaidae]|uniref:AB hydrolase-1 domain-containing protein n=1 Tax=Bifiguratus adelaidae TaxID=1938954 RepID=A0A261Y8A3_9FUNG|nr:hypothetical protein BZG36_00122 [Bifiguratus adelaidae]
MQQFTTIEGAHPLDESVETYTIPGAQVYDRFFDVPLQYAQGANLSAASRHVIRIFVRHLVPIDKVAEMKRLPFLLFLQGGPGCECRLPSSALGGWYKVAFEKGYQILLLDQRGTGLSSPISITHLQAVFGQDHRSMAEHCTLFRADSIIKDCEVIRRRLTAGRDPRTEEVRLTLLGQSFGGFCCTTYLSLFPASLKQVFITGGVPPLIETPDAVYESTYPRMLTQNDTYYKKYPKDVERVKQIVRHLSANRVTLANGGVLSPRRFLQLGLLFGGNGGFDNVHQFVLNASRDLESVSKFSYRTLEMVSNMQNFDSNVLYAVMQELIYVQVPGNRTNWAAERVRNSQNFRQAFGWEVTDSTERLNFTGEMVYPFMFEDYVELRPLAQVAEILAQKSDWGCLYDVETLKNNTVPVAAISYYEDVYVDVHLSEKTAKTIKGCKQWITNEFFHSGLGDDPERVLNHLFNLLRY